MTTAGAPSPWLQRAPAAAARARVFCIPQAGCGTNVFGKWPQLRDGIEFLPVELPGRLSRFGEPVPSTIPALAEEIVDGLADYLDVPAAMFGHCWSALVAYETSVQLERAGHVPTRLFVSSQVAPQDGPVGRMLAMSDQELAVDLTETVRTQGQQPHPDLIEIYVRVLRADIEMSRSYHLPAPDRLSCPVCAIGWTDDDQVSADRMGGWAATSRAAVDFPVFVGPHERFMDAPEELLDAISSGMLSASAAASSLRTSGSSSSSSRNLG